MYLTHLMENNPRFLEIIFDLHQQGHIPTNSWVIDLDTIAKNARIIARKADELGLSTYLMSKQHNRNPYINKLAIAQGLNKLVTVDVQGVLSARRYDMPLGHAGHLNQIPRRDIPLLLSLNPDIVTIYNKEHAFWINDACEPIGRHQDLMLRIYDDGDVCFDGQQGGFRLEELPPLIDALKGLRYVSVTGVTAFPCLSYNETSSERAAPTLNTETINKAADLLGELGQDIRQINMPGNTSSSNMPLLKKMGATHVEPGNSLLGTTPDNAFFDDVAEKTAFAYVTEISHRYDGAAYAYGGGVYHTNYSDKISGLVGVDYRQAQHNRLDYDYGIKQDIDYHMKLKPKKDQRCEIGDSVIFAYRTQMHMTRSFVVPVSGVSGRKKLECHGIFDNANNAFDGSHDPVYPEKVISDINKLIESYI